MTMPIEPPNPERLILFGNDFRLLEIRAMVLRSAGMTAEFVVDIEEFKLRVGKSRLHYDVAICCYTVTEAQRGEIISISNGAGIVVLTLEQFLSPQEFIGRVYDLVKDSRSKLRGREQCQSEESDRAIRDS